MGTAALETVRAHAVRAIVESHADNPSAFLALNGGNRHFTCPDLDGVVVYRESGRRLVQFGGPFAATGDARPLLDRFGEFARRAAQAGGRDPGAVPRHRAVRGGRVHGEPDRRAPTPSTCPGSRCAARSSCGCATRSRARPAAGWSCGRSPLPGGSRRCARSTRGGSAAKGKHAKELEFLVGEYGGAVQPARRLFVGTIDGTLAGYVSYSPALRLAARLAARPVAPAARRPARDHGGDQQPRHRDVHRGGRGLAALRLHPVHRAVAGLRDRLRERLVRVGGTAS